MFEKVSPALKYHSNFLGVTTYNTYCKTGNVGQQLSLRGVDHFFCKKLFFASLCSFISLQAVYQLSGPEV